MMSTDSYIQELRTTADKLEAEGRHAEAQGMRDAAETYAGFQPPPLTDAERFRILSGQLIGAEHDALDYIQGFVMQGAESDEVAYAERCHGEFKQAVANCKRGGLSAEHEQAVCAAVCAGTDGMTSKEWKKLNVVERIPWLELAIGNRKAATEHKPVGIDGASGGTSDITKGIAFKCKDDVTPDYREGGKPGGEPLTAAYLDDNPDWELHGPYITNHFGPERLLTTRAKVGREYVYLFKEVAALRVRKTANAAKREVGR